MKGLIVDTNELNAALRRVVDGKELFGPAREADPKGAIRSCMLRKGISFTDLARITGRSPKQLNKWLSHKHSLKLKQIYLLADAVGLSVHISLKDINDPE